MNRIHYNPHTIMANVTIYHNPRCSTSRKTLTLLRDRGIEPQVIEYLKDPHNAATLRKLIKMLGIAPIDLIRKKEPLYKELGLADKQHDDDALIKAMLEYPALIERPIVVHGNQARLGRPPEDVLEIL